MLTYRRDCFQQCSIIKLLDHPRVGAVVSDQCEYGLLTPDPSGVPTPAKKPTRWMSSSPFMLQRLSRRCSGEHQHQHLVGGRAKAAEDYSLDLITEIRRGMRDPADAEEEWGDKASTFFSRDQEDGISEIDLLDPV